MLSDGEDTSSLVPFEEVLELAKRTEVAIYAIGLPRPRGSARGGFSESDFVLKQFAQETGGKAFFPTSADELAGIYAPSPMNSRAVHGRLRLAQPAPRRRWRRIVVRVERPALPPAPSRGTTARPDVGAGMSAMSLAPLRRSRAPLTSGTSCGASRRSAARPRPLLLLAVLVHTFVLGMYTMETGVPPMAGRRRARLDVRVDARHVYLSSRCPPTSAASASSSRRSWRRCRRSWRLGEMPTDGRGTRQPALRGPRRRLLFAYASFALACVSASRTCCCSAS